MFPSRMIAAKYFQLAFKMCDLLDCDDALKDLAGIAAEKVSGNFVAFQDLVRVLSARPCEDHKVLVEAFHEQEFAECCSIAEAFLLHLEISSKKSRGFDLIRNVVDGVPVNEAKFLQTFGPAFRDAIVSLRPHPLYIHPKTGAVQITSHIMRDSFSSILARLASVQ